MDNGVQGMKARTESSDAYNLASAAVDEDTGVLKGVTVGKAGVQAKGKFVMLDAKGNITRDETKMAIKLPVFTDDRFLETLLGAAQDAGGKVKVRSDHDDTIGARAGYAKNFRRDGDRVACDLYLNKAYKDRDTVIETAVNSPELIGCSIDFIPTFDLERGKALMRVSDLSAVDIVDEGAVTPGGLFLSSRVDNENKDNAATASELNPLTTMAKTEDKKTPPTIDECMAAITEMAGQFAEFNTAMGALKAAPAAASMAAVDELKTQLAAEKTARETLAAEQATFITEQKATIANLAKERAALGLSAKDAKDLSASGEQEAERVRLAADKGNAKPKSYLDAVKAERSANSKLSAYEAHKSVQKAQPDLYHDHLVSQGIAKK